MLQPLPPGADPAPAAFIAAPDRTCEACLAVVPGDYAMNYMFVIGYPGHPALAPIQCPHGEHWACSLACWEAVAHACVTEHGRAMLQQAHERMLQQYGNRPYEI